MGFDIGVSKGSPLVAKTSFASLRNENGVPHASGGFSAGSKGWGLSQRSALLTCEIKMGVWTITTFEKEIDNDN